MNTLSGQTIVITGSSSGVVAAAARMLHEKGAEVVIIGRNPARTKKIAHELGADYFLVDFAELSQVQTLAKKLLAKYPRIDALVNNTGEIIKNRIISVDGHELAFQVNYLAPFLLTALLQERLNASKARIINTSSFGNITGHVNLKDLESSRYYIDVLAYGTGKLMDLIFAMELQRRYGKYISAASFTPKITATNFASKGDIIFKLIYKTPIWYLLASPESSAQTLVWLLTATPGKDWQPGEFYNRPAHKGWKHPQAHDHTLASQLWDKSMEMIKPYLSI